MKKFLVFAFGAIVGASGTYFGMRKAFDKKLDEEVVALKEHYEKHANDLAETIVNNTFKEEDAEPEKKPNRRNCSNIVEYLKECHSDNYVAYDEISTAKEEKDEASEVENDSKLVGKPEIISPDEFGQGNDYDVICLTYYEGNSVLTDDGDEPIGNISEVVGDALEHFGEYAEDVVHVRNHRLKADFEIVLAHESWEGEE